jgi:hypothetical protein
MDTPAEEMVELIDIAPVRTGCDGSTMRLAPLICQEIL